MVVINTFFDNYVLNLFRYAFREGLRWFSVDCIVDLRRDHNIDADINKTKSSLLLDMALRDKFLLLLNADNLIDNLSDGFLMKSYSLSPVKL